MFLGWVAADRNVPPIGVEWDFPTPTLDCMADLTGHDSFPHLGSIIQVRCDNGIPIGAQLQKTFNVLVARKPGFFKNGRQMLLSRKSILVDTAAKACHVFPSGFLIGLKFGLGFCRLGRAVLAYLLDNHACRF